MVRKTLLIVDDEELFTRSLAQGLSTLEPSLRVLTAKDGQVAIDTLEREPVDLVLTDLMMPGVDGFQVLSFLKERRRDLPVLVVTAYERPEVGQRLREFGVGEVIEKPVEFGKLAERILDALRGGGSAAPRGSQLAGRLGAFSPFELLQMLSDLRKTGELVLSRFDGPTARCSLVPGGLGPATCGQLSGREAVLAFVWWRQGDFVFESGDDLPGIETLRVSEVLMDAVRLADEIERRKDALPPRDLPLYLAAGAGPPDDRVGCDLGRVFSALRESPGVTGADLEARLPLAPVKVRLALAILSEAGRLSRPRGEAPSPEAGAPEAAPEFWTALRKHHPGGLRALVAVCPEPPERLYDAVSRIGETLGLASPPVSFSPDGPSFVRLRPASGGILSLTFLPISKKNRYLFDTFVRSVELALVCREGVSHDREIGEWEALVPSGVRLLGFEPGSSMEESISARLRELVSEIPPARRSSARLERTLA